MKIKEIRAFAIDIRPTPKTAPRVPSNPAAGHFVSPMARYPEWRVAPQRCSIPSDMRTACIVTAEDGAWGFGMSLYPGAVAPIINDDLGPALISQDCMATEKLYDMMNRMAAKYGRAGLASYGISAIDTALWDLKGKLLGAPVYELLGGPQKDRIPCYGSNTVLSYGLAASLGWYLELGFNAVKVFLEYGPADGLDGFQRNVEMVARARDIVGDDIELALDCWMSLDLEYAVRLIEALRPYKLKWVEDMLLPEDMDGYAKLRQRVPWQTLATGEHWGTVHPFATAASQGLVDILQPDALWVGGITTTVRICHIAEAFGQSVIAHAGMNYPFGQHLSYAMPAMALGERSESVSPPGVPLEEMVALPGTPVIRDGYLVPSDAPGFGLEIDLNWLEQRAVL